MAITCSVCRVRVAWHGRARLVDDAAHEHLVAADRVDLHVGKIWNGSTPFQVRTATSRGNFEAESRAVCATAFTESSSSNDDDLPLTLGPASPAAFRCSALSTRSGVIGSSVTQTPIAS